MANITLHTQKLAQVIASGVQDENSTSIVMLDWEAWRPLYDQNREAMSLYKEYSARLVRQEPAWSGKPEKQIDAEAKRRFDAGAKGFFAATVNTIRQVRPKVRIGFYSQGIQQANTTSGMVENTELLWLWDIVDVLAPSIYPRSTNATLVAESVRSKVAGAIASVELLRQARDETRKRRRRTDPNSGPNSNSDSNAFGDYNGGSRPLPAIMPYARAFVNKDRGSGSSSFSSVIPFTRGILAAQVQVPAALGVEGVILWGSSSDYHQAGCQMIEDEITGFAGPTIAQCIQNRELCAKQHCSGHGRCVDLDESALVSNCITATATAAASCRCSQSYKGEACSILAF
jgi:hypothetical protein